MLFPGQAPRPGGGGIPNFDRAVFARGKASSFPSGENATWSTFLGVASEHAKEFSAGYPAQSLSVWSELHITSFLPSGEKAASPTISEWPGEQPGLLLPRHVPQSYEPSRGLWRSPDVRPSGENVANRMKGRWAWKNSRSSRRNPAHYRGSTPAQSARRTESHPVENANVIPDVRFPRFQVEATRHLPV